MAAVEQLPLLELFLVPLLLFIVQYFFLADAFVLLNASEDSTISHQFRASRMNSDGLIVKSKVLNSYQRFLYY